MTLITLIIKNNMFADDLNSSLDKIVYPKAVFCREPEVLGSVLSAYGYLL